MKDMVLVDNSVYSFAYQIDNGIPIISYYDDPKDEELLHLMYYMKALAECEDVRQQNRKAFELFKLGEGAEYVEDSQEASGDDLGCSAEVQVQKSHEQLEELEEIPEREDLEGMSDEGFEDMLSGNPEDYQYLAGSFSKTLKITDIK